VPSPPSHDIAGSPAHWTTDSELSEHLAGTRLGRYELLFPLAAGGMGAVWVARLLSSEGVGRIVALKVMLSRDPGDADVQAFFAEARVTTRLDHPNVVRTLELGQEQGKLFIAMELVRGQSLRKLLVELARQKRRLPLSLVVRILSQAAAGLHAAHELCEADGTPLGLIHRDLSPDNILLSYAGQVCVSDFGVAKLSTTASTHTGVVKGKFAYMSPEQVGAEPLDRRSDVFALGVLLWETLTGRRLFRAATPRETVALVLRAAVRDPRELRPEIPKELAELTLRCLAPSPDARPSTADEVARELRRIAREAGLGADEAELAELLSELFAAERADLTGRLDAAEQSRSRHPLSGSIAVAPAETEPTGGTLASSISDAGKRGRVGRVLVFVVALGALAAAGTWITTQAANAPARLRTGLVRVGALSLHTSTTATPPPAPPSAASAEAPTPRRPDSRPRAPRPPSKPKGPEKPQDDLFEDL
jgi:serine/threonine protein kinase